MPAPVWLKPGCQGRHDFHESSLAGLALAGGDFDVPRHPPNVFPRQAQQFGRAQSGQPANGQQGPQGGIGVIEQGAEFLGSVKLDFGQVGLFRPHGVGFEQAMGSRKVVLAHGPAQEGGDGRAPVVAALGSQGGLGGEVLVEVDSRTAMFDRDRESHAFVREPPRIACKNLARIARGFIFRTKSGARSRT